MEKLDMTQKVLARSVRNALHRNGRMHGAAMLRGVAAMSSRAWRRSLSRAKIWVRRNK